MVRKYDSSISSVVDGHGAWHTLYIFRYDGTYAGLQFNRGTNKIDQSWIDSINRVWAKKTEFYGFSIISTFYDYKSNRYLWFISDSKYYSKRYGYSEAVKGPFDCNDFEWYKKLKEYTHSGIADITETPSPYYFRFIFMNNGIGFIYDERVNKFIKPSQCEMLRDKCGCIDSM